MLNIFFRLFACACTIESLALSFSIQKKKTISPKATALIFPSSSKEPISSFHYRSHSNSPGINTNVIISKPFSHFKITYQRKKNEICEVYKFPTVNTLMAFNRAPALCLIDTQQINCKQHQSFKTAYLSSDGCIFMFDLSTFKCTLSPEMPLTREHTSKTTPHPPSPSLRTILHSATMSFSFNCTTLRVLLSDILSQ